MNKIKLIKTDRPTNIGLFKDTGNLHLRSGHDIPRGENVFLIIVDEAIDMDNQLVTDGMHIWNEEATTNHKVIASNSNDLTPNFTISIDDLNYIIRFYNDNKYFPEIELEKDILFKVSC